MESNSTKFLENKNVQLFFFSVFYRSLIVLTLYALAGKASADILQFADCQSYMKIAESFPFPYWDQALERNTKHYPLFPFFLFLVDLLLNNMVISAHVAPILISSFSTVVFFNIAGRFSGNAFELALIFTLLPPKWVQVSVYPLSETMFVFCLLLAVLFHLDERYILSYVCLGLLLITRPLGVLILFSFFLHDIVFMKKYRLIPHLALAVIPFFLFHSYLYLIFDHSRLLAHTSAGGGWGGSVFSYPFSGLISGIFDKNLILPRKIYTLSVFLVYVAVFIAAFRHARKRQFLLFSLIVIPYFIFTLFLKGENYNWWMFCLPRFLLPLAPFGILFLLGNLKKQFLKILILPSIFPGFIYTIGSYYLHLIHRGVV